MLKFDEKNELNSVNGALAIRLELEKIVDEIYKLIEVWKISRTYLLFISLELEELVWVRSLNISLITLII